MGRSKRKKKLPSQYRYDQSHPTVSFRLPARLRSRLDQLLVGESFASWVIGHLGNDEARVNARVEQLADKRDNLGATIFRLKQQAEDLDKQVGQRRWEVARPIEEERARLREQLDTWYQREKARTEARIERLRSEEREAKDEAFKVKTHLVYLENTKQSIETERRQWSEEKETWEKQARRATEFINRCPWLFCRQCPGAVLKQILVQMMDTVSSFQVEDSGSTGPPLNEGHSNG